MTQFIDANVIVKAFTENEDKEKCRISLSAKFITNTLCLVEAYHAISIIKNDKMYAANAIKSLFKSDGIIIELNKNLLFESFKRIDKYELNIFDLIHYVTALIYNCSKFLSYDRHFNGLEITRSEP
ncbi:PIN domain-containing protein [Candidatus Woesearchaeota archaeon]|nr:PIN domain-containing protein [Candidatus Woesearchaeota archaeon]